MNNRTSDIEAMLNDPEGRQFVRDIQARKELAELRERIERSLTRHRVIRDGIAEPSGWCETCGNLDDGDQELHQAEVLVGLRQEALAVAWDQGHKQGGPMHDVNYDDPDAHNRNPYREAAK